MKPIRTDRLIGIIGLALSALGIISPRYCTNPTKDAQVELGVQCIHDGRDGYLPLSDKDTVSLITCFEINQEYYDKNGVINILPFPFVLKRPGYDYIDKISYQITSSTQKFYLNNEFYDVGSLVKDRDISHNSIRQEVEVSENLSLKHEINPIDNEYCIYNSYGITNGFVNVIVYTFTLNQSGYAPRKYIIKNHIYVTDAIDSLNVTCPYKRLVLNGEISNITDNKPYIVCIYKIDKSQADYYSKTYEIIHKLEYSAAFKNTVFNYFYYHPYFYALIFCIILLGYFIWTLFKRETKDNKNNPKTKKPSKVNLIKIIIYSCLLMIMIWAVWYFYKTMAEESWMPFLF